MMETIRSRLYDPPGARLPQRRAQEPFRIEILPQELQR